jgi:hypothetical protein
VRAAVLLFVVQRWDVSGMAVSRGDPVYRQAVLQALHNGVQVGGGTQRPHTHGDTERLINSHTRPMDTEIHKGDVVLCVCRCVRWRCVGTVRGSTPSSTSGCQSSPRSTTHYPTTCTQSTGRQAAGRRLKTRKRGSRSNVTSSRTCRGSREQYRRQ